MERANYCYWHVEIFILLICSFQELNLSGVKLSKPVVDKLCELVKNTSLSDLILGSTSIGNVSELTTLLCHCVEKYLLQQVTLDCLQILYSATTIIVSAGWGTQDSWIILGEDSRNRETWPLILWINFCLHCKIQYWSFSHEFYSWAESWRKSHNGRGNILPSFYILAFVLADNHSLRMTTSMVFSDGGFEV